MHPPCACHRVHHSVNSSSHSVNGDIAIQWEWSNFDPSQNSNPFTDFDKTLQNWLRPRDEHVTQNLCQLTVREHLGKYVKYKAFFYSDLFFSPDSPTEAIVDGFSRTVTQITRNHARKCLFWGLHDDRKHLGDQIPQKLLKLGVNMLCRASQLRVNEDWRHRRMTSLAHCSISVFN